MPGPGPSRSIIVIAVAAVPLLALVLVAVPAPAQALSGEMTVELGKALSVTLNDTKDNDLLYWDWEVVGGSPNVSFWVWKGSFREFCMYFASRDRTLHHEAGTNGSGHVSLMKSSQTVAVWSHNSTQNATIRYHLWINPVDMTMTYSLVAVAIAVPLAAIAIIYIRSRRKGGRTASAPPGT